MPIPRSKETPPQEARLTVTPPAGSPGELVTVEIRRLPAELSLFVGLGALNGNQELLDRAVTDPEGSLVARIRVPDWASRDRKHFFFLAYDDERQQPFAYSSEFHVTDEDGVFAIEGRISGEGTDCTLLESAEGRLYALTSMRDTYGPGTAVRVTGTHVADTACPEGIGIRVLEVRPT